VTSPPYDNLRTYHEGDEFVWNFDIFKPIADEDNGFIQNIIDGFEDYISKGYYGVFSKMEDKIKEKKYEEIEAV